MLVDSHAHLDSLDEPLEDVLGRAAAAGVTRVVTIGDDVPTSEAAAAIAARFDSVWATAGLHPHNAKDGSPETLERIERLARGPRAVGVGETGLDYYYDHSPRNEQRRVFVEQIRMAVRLDTTLVVHTRDAWDDTFAILADEPLPPRIVFHCWTGGPAHAERAAALGAWLSFSGIVSFASAHAVREAAAITPLGRMLVETDSPYLAPVPHRGKRNEPAFVAHVADAIARIKDVPVEEVAAATTANALAAFALG